MKPDQTATTGSQPLNRELIDIADIADRMLELSSRILKHTAVGMYRSFILNSIDGTDCPLAIKSQKLYTKQREHIMRELRQIAHDILEIEYADE